jgi:NAD(P)H-dependent FMN reductase
MNKILIISTSVRKGKKSDRVALYFESFLKQKGIQAEVMDLAVLDFPIFEERLKYLENPSEKVKKFSADINAADGIIIVAPEYNGGYPASLKNAIDLLYDEWKRKPVAIAAVSSGDFAGTQMIQQLQFILWKIGAWMVPARFHVSKVAETFNEDGSATNPERSDRQASGFVDELLWCVQRYRS